LKQKRFCGYPRKFRRNRENEKFGIFASQNFISSEHKETSRRRMTVTSSLNELQNSWKIR
jgi:hypothetical protein